VRLFFSLKHDGITYPCALVQWFKHVADSPDEITGMWVVEPELLEDGACCVSVIHLPYTSIWGRLCANQSHLLTDTRRFLHLLCQQFH
jgi:hypothetical protein